jgi:CMP-N-acetylneuraminic acid synthetase
MSILAVIPARSGSKRIKDKNIQSISGKPMLVWTIEAALESGIFSRVHVSTDNQYYQKLSISAGASCDFLRDNYVDDITPVSQATLYALRQATDYYGDSYDTIVQLMPNCPTRDSSSILEAYKEFSSSKDNGISIISGFEFGWMNPWWAHTVSANGTPIPLFPGSTTMRSQDMQRLYCPSGAIWISTVNSLMSYSSFYSPGWRFAILPWDQSVDIDDIADMHMADLILRRRTTCDTQ